MNLDIKSDKQIAESSAVQQNKNKTIDNVVKRYRNVVELTPIGMYKQNLDEQTIDAFLWLREKNENCCHPVIINAHGYEEIRLIRNLKAFCEYEAQFLKTSGITAGRAKVSEMTTPVLVRKKIKVRTKQVRNAYPFVPLAEVKTHLSALNFRGYAYRQDVKTVQVYVQEIATYEDVTTFRVVDGTSTNVLLAHADPSVFHNAGVRVASFVYLLGTLELDESNQIKMNVCNILPTKCL